MLPFLCHRETYHNLFFSKLRLSLICRCAEAHYWCFSDFSWFATEIAHFGYKVQARNQLGTPGLAKSFPRGAQIFQTMSNSFQLCLTDFSRGGAKRFCRWASPPLWLRVCRVPQFAYLSIGIFLHPCESHLHSILYLGPEFEFEFIDKQLMKADQGLKSSLATQKHRKKWHTYTQMKQ